MFPLFVELLLKLFPHFVAISPFQPLWMLAPPSLRNFRLAFLAGTFEHFPPFADSDSQVFVFPTLFDATMGTVVS